jgi:hypothetical protein
MPFWYPDLPKSYSRLALRCKYDYVCWKKFDYLCISNEYKGILDSVGKSIWYTSGSMSIRIFSGFFSWNPAGYPAKLLGFVVSKYSKCSLLIDYPF